MASSSLGFHGCRARGRLPARRRCRPCRLCQRRSRSQTRSIARWHACEQNRCSGERRERRKHSQQPGRSQAQSKKVLTDDPRGLPNRLFRWWFSLFDALPVTLALPLPLLLARRRGPVNPPGLPPRPGPRRLPALRTAIALACVLGAKAPLASLEQALPGPPPANLPLAPVRRLLFDLACTILGRAPGR